LPHGDFRQSALLRGGALGNDGYDTPPMALGAAHVKAAAHVGVGEVGVLAERLGDDSVGVDGRIDVRTVAAAGGADGELRWYLHVRCDQHHSPLVESIVPSVVSLSSIHAVSASSRWWCGLPRPGEKPGFGP